MTDGAETLVADAADQHDLFFSLKRAEPLSVFDNAFSCLLANVWDPLQFDLRSGVDVHGFRDCALIAGIFRLEGVVLRFAAERSKADRQHGHDRDADVEDRSTRFP